MNRTPKGVLVLLTLKTCSKCRAFITPPGMSDWTRIIAHLPLLNLDYKVHSFTTIEELDASLPAFIVKELKTVPLLIYIPFETYNLYFNYHSRQVTDPLRPSRAFAVAPTFTIFKQSRTVENVLKWLKDILSG